MSKIAFKIKTFYDKGLYTREQVEAFYNKGIITAEELNIILNEENNQDYSL